jgi:hypothetical protein
MDINPGKTFELKPVIEAAGLHDAVQVKSVFETLEVRLILVFEAEQMVFKSGLFDTSGVGATVTTKLYVCPIHPLAEGVIW